MHRFSRTIFFTADGAAPLLRLYVRLVALELTLKDEDASNYQRVHDVVQMVLNRNDAALTPLANALNASLGILHCTSKRGDPVTVSPAVYPGMRYLLHESDHAGTTTDANLASALQALEDLLVELNRQGVRPC